MGCTLKDIIHLSVYYIPWIVLSAYQYFIFLKKDVPY